MSNRAEPTEILRLSQIGIKRVPFDLKAQKDAHPDIIEDDFWSTAERVWDYTSLQTAALHNLYCATRYIIDAGIKGDFVECGVLLGGSVMAVEHVLLRHDKASRRRVFALDTFSGFVARDEKFDIDMKTGVAVCHPQQKHNDFSKGAITNMQSIGFEGLTVVQGDVLKSIPTLDVTRIALLRLDTDTYETTKFELETLYDRVVPGGVVIIDDYGYTFGCKKAVDDFLASRPVFLQRINRNVRAWVKAAR